MDEAHKELVKRLQRIQVGMANEEEDAVLAAVAAIEALAGEVGRLRVMVETNKATAERVMAERDRLKAALVRLGSVEAFTSSQGICPELYERITYARKELGDAS